MKKVWGIDKIRQDLFKKHIDKSIIHKVLDEYKNHYDDSDEDHPYHPQNQLLLFAEKKHFGPFRLQQIDNSAEYYKVKNREIASFMRRGFRYNDIKLFYQKYEP